MIQLPGLVLLVGGSVLGAYFGFTLFLRPNSHCGILEFGPPPSRGQRHILGSLMLFTSCLMALPVLVWIADVLFR